MAKFKLKSLPKKPKRSASNATKENYLRKVAEVRAYNQGVAREKAKSEHLNRRIAGISSDSVKPGRVSAGIGPRKRKSSGKKSPAKRRKRKR
jgi:hypothetical protein